MPERLPGDQDSTTGFEYPMPFGQDLAVGHDVFEHVEAEDAVETVCREVDSGGVAGDQKVDGHRRRCACTALAGGADVRCPQVRAHHPGGAEPRRGNAHATGAAAEVEYLLPPQCVRVEMPQEFQRQLAVPPCVVTLAAQGLMLCLVPGAGALGRLILQRQLASAHKGFCQGEE